MQKAKRNILIVAVAALLLLAGIALAVSGAGQPLYSHTAQLTGGLSYTNTIYEHPSAGREESHMLTLNNNGGSVYPIVMACDTIYGGFTISRVIEYAEQQGYNVLAAVNSDFFHSYVIPIGMVVEDGVYKSSPEGRSAIGFRNDGSAFISDPPSITITLENEENGETFSLTQLNKSRYDTYGLYLFSSAFSTVSTRTATPGWMVRLRILDGELTVHGEMELEVEELIEGSEAVPIGDEYLILTAAHASNLGHVFSAFEVGDRVTLNTDCDDAHIRNAAWVSGGGDVIVRNGRITEEEDWDQLVLGRGPRNAVGVKSDGSLVFYLIDGRQSQLSNGLTQTEMAEQMLALGCVDVLCLDGGGSAAMALRQPGATTAQVVNSPSDGKERSCGCYILLVSDERSDGRAERLHLLEDGALVLANSTIPLHYTAMDSAYLPAEAGAVSAASSGLGSVDGHNYTAGSAAGIDHLTLSSEAAQGSAALHIVGSVDALTISDSVSGEAISQLRPYCGDSVTLAAAAAYLNRPVLTSAAAFSYAVNGDIGSIDDQGVFTAGETPGASGSILVSGYGHDLSIPVRLRADFQDIKGHWAEEYINTLADLDIVAGVSGIAYAPESHIRRGDFILMLYRAAGQPELSSFSGFTDVDPDRYYSDAIIWAGSAGIAQGGSDGSFRPAEPLTREQAMAFIWRAMSVLERAAEPPADELTELLLSTFNDGDQVSDFARLPAAALVESGIISGAGNKLDPGGLLTRAQMAKILCLAMKF